MVGWKDRWVDVVGKMYGTMCHRWICGLKEGRRDGWIDDGGQMVA